MRLVGLALVLLLAAAGCIENYNRAALVPRATPRMTTGQPLTGRGQLSLGASSVAHLGDPKPGTDNQGIEIPGTQLFGALKGGIGDIVSFGFIYENGLDAGAKKLNASQPDVDHGNVHGYGVTLDFSIPIDDRWRLGVGVDAMLWSCPYTSYDTEVNGTYTIVDKDTDTVDTLAASITPSFKIDDDLTVFGGLTVRQHPTIDQKGTDVSVPGFNNVEVQSGPGQYIVSGGIEGKVANGNILLSAMAYYDISRDPAKYGPGMALMMAVPFGKKSKRPQDPPPGMIYAPPGYAPQPYPYPPEPSPAPAPAPPPGDTAPTPPPAPPPGG